MRRAWSTAEITYNRYIHFFEGDIDDTLQQAVGGLENNGVLEHGLTHPVVRLLDASNGSALPELPAPCVR
jgi:hypothetical protein